MKDNWTIRYGENKEAAIESQVGLGEMLEMLHCEHKEHGVLAEIAAPSGDCMSIGLGKFKSVICWTPASNREPYLISVSMSEALGGETCSFLYMGDHSEFPSKNLIDLLLAKNVVISFYSTGIRPTLIEWEAV